MIICIWIYVSIFLPLFYLATFQNHIHETNEAQPLWKFPLEFLFQSSSRSHFLGSILVFSWFQFRAQLRISKLNTDQRQKVMVSQVSVILFRGWRLSASWDRSHGRVPPLDIRPGTPAATTDGQHWRPVKNCFYWKTPQEWHLVVVSKACTVCKRMALILLEYILVTR